MEAFRSSSFSGNRTNHTRTPATAAKEVKIIIGRGSSIVEIKGDMAEKTLLKKLQIPSDVAQKRIGKTSALLT